MEPTQLEILGLDAVSHRSFIVYFSDETFVSLTADQLAVCFPHREHVPTNPDESI